MKMEELPTWLQQLWKHDVSLARRAEKDWSELMTKLEIADKKVFLPNDKAIEDKAHDIGVKYSESYKPTVQTGRYYDTKNIWLNAIEWVKNEQS